MNLKDRKIVHIKKDFATYNRKMTTDVGEFVEVTKIFSYIDTAIKIKEIVARIAL